jgi:hypothetical protein
MVMQGGCSKLVARVYLVQHNLSLWFVRERKFVRDCTICKWVSMYQFKKIKKLKRLKVQNVNIIFLIGCQWLHVFFLATKF